MVVMMTWDLVSPKPKSVVQHDLIPKCTEYNVTHSKKMECLLSLFCLNVPNQKQTDPTHKKHLNTVGIFQTGYIADSL